ncbi:MAG: 4-alpha-glucanotransferase [Dokdonella sp.]
MTDDLAELARSAGVVGTWVDAGGYRHVVADEALFSLLEAQGLPCRSPRQRSKSSAALAERRRLPPPMLTTWVGSPTRLSFALPSPAPFRLQYEDGAVVEGHVFEGEGGHWLPPVLHAGYHQLELAGSRIALAVAPLRACAPMAHATSRRRPWGISLRGNSPLDFTRLMTLARSAAGHGADALAVGNLHDQTANDQRWLDSRRIDPAAALARTRSGTPGVADTISTLLQFYQGGLPRDELLLREFLRFDRDGDGSLSAYAHFRTTHDASASQSGLARSELDASQAESVGFQVFLQWLSQRGRANAQAVARAAGMAIGLVADFELTGYADGRETWSDPDLFLTAVRSHDPTKTSAPLEYVPYSPANLVARGFQPFIDLLRANMGGVGGLNIHRFDRWWRQWLQHSDAQPGSGAYLEFPFEDLLRLLVLESVRHQCIVIVEGADGLPERLRDAIDQAGVLRSSSFMATAQGVGVVFADDDIVEASPAPSVVSSSQADQPGLLAWWRGDDLLAAAKAGDPTIMAATRELGERELARRRLLTSLGIERRSGGRSPSRDRRDPLRSITGSRRRVQTEPYEQKIVDVVLQKLGNLSADLVLVDIDDLFGQSISESLAELDAGSVGRILDSTLVRTRLNRLDDLRRSPPQNRSLGHDQARMG